MVTLPPPVMIHCSTATRASAVWLLHAVRSGQYTPEAALEYGRSVPFKCLAQPKLMAWLDTCALRGAAAEALPKER